MFLDEPESKEVDEIMKKNNEIKQAKVTLRELSKEEENQRIAELREKHILDTQDIYETGKNKEKRKIAKKLLDKNMSLEQIIEITELSKEEILKIQKETN